MWIFAGGMFRSGSTLQFQIVAELIERAGMGERVPWAMPEDFTKVAEQHPDSGDAPDTMLVFKTHVCKHAMRERLRDGRARAVRVHRDLRDVAVSGAQKAGIEPTPEYCREVAEGNLACANGWPDVDTVRSWSYERLTRETETVCLEMAAFLGVPCTPGLAAELARAFSPDEQRERIQRAVRSGAMVPAVPGDTRLHAERDLLHPDHLRDGATGKWRDHLPPESVELIESIAGEWLIANGYPLSGSSDLQTRPLTKGGHA